jgi:hypothetical protein
LTATLLLVLVVLVVLVVVLPLLVGQMIAIDAPPQGGPLP